MEVLNNNTFNVAILTGSVEPVRDENGNIISITSSEHQLNEINQFSSQPSIYNYYTSSYLGKIFDFDFNEFGVESDQNVLQQSTVPDGMLLISQSEYDYLVTINSSLQIEVAQLNVITGSLQETISSLEITIDYLLQLIGGGSASFDPIITTVNLPQGIIDVQYYGALNAIGGIIPYTWSISAGALPTGLTLDSSTGIVSGIPTQLFNGNIIFKVTDFLQKTNLKAVGLIIKESPPPPPTAIIITTPSPIPTAYKDEPYEYPLSASGGTGTYYWSVTGSVSLPSGLNLSGLSGLVYGTPIEVGEKFVRFRVRDDDVPFNEATKVLKVIVDIRQ